MSSLFHPLYSVIDDCFQQRFWLLLASPQATYWINLLELRESRLKEAGQEVHEEKQHIQNWTFLIRIWDMVLSNLKKLIVI